MEHFRIKLYFIVKIMYFCEKFNITYMKYREIYTLAVFCFIISLFTSNIMAQPQSSRKSFGPTFITSPSFVNGIHHVTYDGNKVPSSSISIVGLSQFMGFQFSPYFMLGLGVSFDYWTKPKNAFVPIYLDLRFNFMDHNISPHMYLNLGYASQWSVDSKTYSAYGINSDRYVLHGAKSGLMFESGIGVKAHASYSNAIILTFTAKVLESAIKYNNGESTSGGTQAKYLANTYENNWYVFIGVKAGIVF